MSYENHFEKIHSGLAVTGYSERFSNSSLSSFSLSYNYTLKLGTNASLVAAARAGRHFYSISSDYYKVIDPYDPLLNRDLSQANWTADVGLLLKVSKFYFGLVANNVVHTDDEIQSTTPSRVLYNNQALIAGTSFTINDHLVSDHSLYIPFEKGNDMIDGYYRIDLNNTLTINDLFLAGLSLEKTNEKFFSRFNAGVRIKDYFRVVFLIYSDERKEFEESNFRGEVFMGFKF